MHRGSGSLQSTPTENSKHHSLPTGAGTLDMCCFSEHIIGHQAKIILILPFHIIVLRSETSCRNPEKIQVFSILADQLHILQLWQKTVHSRHPANLLFMSSYLCKAFWDFIPFLYIHSIVLDVVSGLFFPHLNANDGNILSWHIPQNDSELLGGLIYGKILHSQVVISSARMDWTIVNSPLFSGWSVGCR